MIVILLLLHQSLSATNYSWSEMIDAAKQNEALAPFRDKLITHAREIAATPIVKRAKTLAEVGQNRTWLDGRANALEPEIREQFALAMSDHGTAGVLDDELPLLAAAYRLTGDAAFLDRIIAQLRETVTWSPLQRPGWTLYHPGARLPADGKDGNWLATGRSVRALADMLEILPVDALSKDLNAQLTALLEKEIAGVVDDWQTKRPWFVRGNNAITNQWVLPTEGLVRSCLVTGVDTHKDAYELGVANLLKAEDAHGPAGEFEEGIGYASFTVTSILSAARAMAAHGDRRALDHPFLKNFPMWLVHHFQPGGMVINCFDAGAARDGAAKTGGLLAMFAIATGNPVARWGLDYIGGPPDTLPGLLARALPPLGPRAAPPLYAAYDRAARVNWRDSWKPNATGVWVRGGHPLDQHDHYDRGHVNFIYKGKPILIEAGTPFYHHPLMGSHFSSGVGHNVLQLGTIEPHGVNSGDTLSPTGWQQKGIVAPITVRRLDAQGGDVCVTVSSGYEGLAKWTRDVTWDAAQMTVDDRVELAPDKDNVVLFRWHLGTNDDVTITGDGAKWQAEWPAAKIAVEASGPVALTQTKLPDNTINAVSEDWQKDARHTCLVVQSTHAVAALDMTTRIAGL